MKNEYDFLNEIEVAESEMEEMEVTEFEKTALKKKLKSKIGAKKSIWRKKSAIAAAVCCVLIGGGAALGITNPTLAANIPVVGDIFRFLDGGRTGNYDLYQQNAAGIHMTQKDKGVSITIEQALFDGKSIYYTYTIESEKDLGDSPIMQNAAAVSIKGYTDGMGGSSQIQKVEQNKYVGQDEWTIDEYRDSVDVNVHFDSIGYFIGDEHIELKGQWDFAFQLDAVENKEQIVALTTTKEEISVTVDTIVKTPMSLIVSFQYTVPEKYEKLGENGASISIEMDLKDDKQNEYSANGSTVNSNEPGVYYGTITFGKIEEGAQKIFVTPRIITPTGGGGVAIDENGNETHFEITIPPELQALDGAEFAPIEIELQN